MGIFSALGVGVSGLQSQANKLNVISDNIANINTVGYKQTVANFRSLVAYNTAFAYSPGGVVGNNRQLNNAQGEMINTASATDIGIIGAGFFPVSDQTTAGNILYTRAGSFNSDENGNFKNGAGYYLQGWALDTTGALAAGLTASNVDAATAVAGLTTVNVQDLTQGATPTTSVFMQANLKAGELPWAGPPAYDATLDTANMAEGVITPHFNRAFDIIDSAGTGHSCNINFLKTASDTWSVEIVINPATDVASGNGQVAYGTVSFNGNGTLAAVSASLTQAIAIDWQSYPSPITGDPDITPAASSITFTWGTAGIPTVGLADGLSQLDTVYHVTKLQQDGLRAGDLTGVVITNDGYVTASYSNGTVRNFYKIPLANFAEPNDLQSISGNVYAQSLKTGDPTFSQSADGSGGRILSGALESSNVDLATQLTDMIIAQRAYQSNTKVISTTDGMIQSLTQMLG